MEEFKALIKHHLTSTEWKYTSPSILFPPVPGRPTAAIPFLGDGLTAAGDLHPIRVIGTSWIGRDVRRLERQMEGLGDGTMGDRVEGMVGELGEAMTTRVR